MGVYYTVSDMEESDINFFFLLLITSFIGTNYTMLDGSINHRQTDTSAGRCFQASSSSNALAINAHT